ncbi:MAG: ATP-binding protein [Anaerolineae bacterium]|jgi:anti-sigma regulatory factor (Ser/Thr protein kinase)|nr:ATP-binding protein [Anaerolineae bacterium]
MNGKQHRLRVPGELEQVRAVCEFVADVARAVGLGEDGIFQCQLSVEEICTNIVEHGYKFNGGDKSIEVLCEQHGNMLRISILDDAPLFNPLALNDPDPGMTLWEREGGGWGVFFVKQYMSSVNYLPGNQRNCLVLEKQITPD